MWWRCRLNWTREATVIGEENDAAKTYLETGRAWIIDHIDGTFNPVRGIHYLTTSVAATVGGEPVAVWSVLPALDRVYLRDEDGTYLDGESIAVSDRGGDQASAVALTIPPAHGERSEYAAGTGDVDERFGTVVRLCSAQVTFALLARSAIDGAVTQQRPNPWDSLAGAHLIRQAGGVVTDMDGDR